MSILNNNNGYNEHNPDIPNFGSRQQMDEIRQNEYLERQARLKRAAVLQRQQRLRQKRIEQLKQTITAWAVLAFIVIAIIAIIVGIVSSARGGDDKGGRENNKASEAVLSAYSDFQKASYNFTGDSGASDFDSYTRENANVVLNYLEYPSYYSIISQSSAYINSSFSDEFRDAVRNCPIFSNGYVWSSNTSMKYPLTNGYLYDTNASFICAVSDICSWDAETDFLYKTDSTSSGSKDISNGMTVLQKLELATDYFFDKNDLNGGGIRYNEDDGLVYVLTSANNGLSGAKPSNIFHNHSFGYLDLYNNILFNKAMTNLARLYTHIDDTQKADFYKSIAKKNKEAITDKFFNNSLGRYVGFIDSDGKVHDLGYTAVNLFAISEDVAEKEQRDKIFSWIDGETKINTDTCSSGKVYKDKKLPVFNTVCALEESWFDLEGDSDFSGSANYGKYSQNGGESFASEFFNLAARSSYQSSKKIKSNVKKYAGSLSASKNGHGEDLFALSSAFIGAKSLFGIDTDCEILYVSPILSSGSSFAVRNISFDGNIYGFKFSENQVLITASLSSAVKIKIGSYDENTQFKMSVIEDGIVTSEETVKADKDGYVSVYKRFGSGSFIVLELEK